MRRRHLIQSRDGRIQCRLRLLELRHQLVGIDAGEHLALFHMVVEIDFELVDAARHFRADIDLIARRERARGADIDGEKPARDRLGDIGVGRPAAQREASDHGKQQDAPADPVPAAASLALDPKAQPRGKNLVRFGNGVNVVHGF